MLHRDERPQAPKWELECTWMLTSNFTTPLHTELYSNAGLMCVHPCPAPWLRRGRRELPGTNNIITALLLYLMPNFSGSHYLRETAQNYQVIAFRGLTTPHSASSGSR